MKALLPIWIIGAPMLYVLFDWMRMPKSTTQLPRPVRPAVNAPL